MGASASWHSEAAAPFEWASKAAWSFHPSKMTKRLGRILSCKTVNSKFPASWLLNSRYFLKMVTPWLTEFAATSR